LLREGIAMASRGRDRRTPDELHADDGLAHHAQHVAEQIVVADEGRHVAAHATGAIAQDHRLHHAARIDGGAEQAGVEGQHLAAVAGRAFRKQSHGLAPQAGGQAFEHGAGASLASTQVQAAGGRRQPAGQRPVANFRFGHEAQRHHAGQYRDIEPGHVVGDRQLRAA